MAVPTPLPPRPVVVLAGHLPPPVHGMSVAFAALADLLDEHAVVVRVRTTPRRVAGGLAYHLGRALVVLGAAVRIAMLRRRSACLVLSADAGKGMAHLVGLAAVARALNFAVVVQHHSRAYVERDTPLVRLLTRVAPAATHVCSCDGLAAGLRQRYPRVRSTAVVPVSYAIEPPDPPPAADDRPAGTIVLGHYGNLTIAKGLGVAVATVRDLLGDGLPVRLVLAGPLGGAGERELLAAARADGLPVTWVGPVTAEQRKVVLAGVDLLLFPSTYVDESFGLALWEGLREGTPGLAYRAGCLTQQLTGAGGTVLEPGDDFAAAARNLVQGWLADPAARAGARRSARSQAGRVIGDGRTAADRLCRELAVAAAT